MESTDTHTHTPGGPLDYDYIDEGLYIGTNQCCMTGLAEVLRKEGITADVSLEGERLDQPYGVEEYLWLPVPDLAAPSQDQLALGVVALSALVAHGKKVYVHCTNGHGRSTTLVVAYFVSEGRSVDEAIAFIKTKRPSIHLSDAQVQALHVFEATPHAMPAQKDHLYKCPVCGMKYREEATAKKCEAWCAEHHSCNLDIIKDAVTDDCMCAV